MKKTLLTSLIAMTIFITHSQAQKAKFGIKGGVNFANWSGEAAETVDDIIALSKVFDTETKAGYHVGTFASIAISDRLVLEPALLYTTKGIKVAGRLPESSADLLKILNPQVDITVNTHYIDLPVVAKYYLTDGFNIFGGAQFSYLVSNELDMKAGALGFNLLNEKLDIKTGFRKLDVGMTAGLGYQFNNGINLSGSYDLGLTSLDENNRFDAFNRGVKLSVGYTF